MTDREEFRALLYGTFYESISDSAIIRQQHEKIRTWVQSNIPSRLYRYRAVNDHTFDAFRKDEIWGSSIFSFNDILPVKLETFHPFASNSLLFRKKTPILSSLTKNRRKIAKNYFSSFFGASNISFLERLTRP